MKFLIGLGNPGEKYQNTRHNAGFLFLDYLAAQLGGEGFKVEKKFKSEICKVGDLLLVKPQTFMNLSGEALVALVNFYKCPLEDVLVIYDDVDLKLGDFRLRAKGSAGTHNGMKSIIACLGATEFPRLRIGIESRGEHAPAQQDLHSFVLENFREEELLELEKVFGEMMKELELKFDLNRG